ncbi:MAG: metallophosphoesterase [Planctomycetes bacterium]|nr:metallophosphoesterase [Planctomycetota bacterium]
MKRLLIFLLTICLASSVASAAIIKGPYLIYPGDNTKMTVLWQEDATHSCTLEWGTDTGYADGNVAVTEYGTDHQSKYDFTGLTPGTKYFYRVDEDDNNAGTFYAAPAASAESLKFFAYGDTRNHPERQDSITEQMISAYTADPNYQTLTLFSGDWCDKGRTETSWTNDWFNRNYSNLMEIRSNLPYNGATGNHETNIGASDDGDLYLAYYPYPYIADKYWSFDYGPVHFIILDQYTNGYGVMGATQLAWLESDLAASTKDWKVITLHAPGWSSGDHSNNSEVQNSVQPLCEEYGVQLIFAGHNHNYNRAYVNGVFHITTGGGGASFDSIAPWAENIDVAIQDYHFCKIDIQGTTLSFEVANRDGSVIDSFAFDAEIASFPSPDSGATEISRLTDLSWTAGLYADDANGHKVYFGTTGTPPLVDDPCQPQGSTTYSPDILEPKTTYYWAVDEVNLATSPYIWPGFTWNFTTAEYVIVDDFEGHPSDSSMQAAWTKEASNVNMTTGLVQASAITFVHSGWNAMQFNYDNTASPYYSEVEQTYASSQNWTLGDIEALVLYFHGTAGNDTAEQMYVRLEDADGNDATVVYGADPKYLQDPNIIAGEMGDASDNYLIVTSWETWNIDLQDFVDANNVDLTQVKKIAVGFGDGSAPSGDAIGTVYFDDLRLYMPRCVSEYALGDFSGDCESTYEDLDVIAGGWLQSDYLYTDFNGVLDPCFSGTYWVAGQSGNALLFDGVDDWVDISDDLLTNFQDKTITMWIKPGSSTGTDDEYVFGTNQTRQRCNIFLGGSSSGVSGAVQNKLHAHLAGTDNSGYGIADPALSDSTLTPGTWYHVAFTVWNRTDGYARGELFLDALSQSTTGGATPKLAGPLQGANLGSYSDGTGTGFANVTIDDFRIYDKILLLAEIEDIKNGTDTATPWLQYKFDESSGLIAADSGESKSVYIKLDSPAEAYRSEAHGQRKVNFRDLALMAESWLDGVQYLWP